MLEKPEGSPQHSPLGNVNIVNNPYQQSEIIIYFRTTLTEATQQMYKLYIILGNHQPITTYDLSNCSLTKVKHSLTRQIL